MENKAKLFSHQAHSIEQFIDRTYYELEAPLLEKYKAFDIADLNSSDYDAIMEDLAEWYSEMNAKYGR